MNITLRNEFNGGCWCAPEAVWTKALSVAEEYGWEPAGTVPPYGAEGDYGYTIRGGQEVDGDDADALADALEVALEEDAVRVGDREKISRLIELCHDGPFSIM